MKILNKSLKSSTILQRYTGFTLAEVLITLGIIGVVAAITIPIVMNNIQDAQFKTAYKKSFADISQAFALAISQENLTPRAAVGDSLATASEWAVLKEAFKVGKDCTKAQLNDCWADGDKVWWNSLPNTMESNSFIDASGRSWAQYNDSQNLYLVDVNGFKTPNRFGKDRWIFVLADSAGNMVTKGFPVKIGLEAPSDFMSADPAWCQFPPCYYFSWMYK